MAKISILVPVYNVENYLAKCLDSIVRQTFGDIEIICMDDGSTDTSSEILDKYAENDNRIKIIHKANSGYGSTMNQAMALAEGDYIGIVESDDYIAEDMYEKMYYVAKAHELDFVKTDFYQLWEHEDGTETLNYLELTRHKDLYNRVIEPNKEKETYYMEKFTWNALYRRDFLLENSIRYNETPGASYQDNGFWFQTFYYAKKVMFMDQAFYRYKQDNPNSSVNSNNKIYAFKNEYDYIRSFLLQQNETDIELYKICFHFRMDGYLFTLSKLADRYKAELAKVLREECSLYEQNKEADYTRLSEGKLNIIRQICNDPIGYAKQQIRSNEHIREVVKGYKHIVIYGAGNYGNMVYFALSGKLSKDVKIDFAVTKLDKKIYIYSNIVKEISEFAAEKDTCLVIVAVKEESAAFDEMHTLLSEKGFANVKNYYDIINIKEWKNG